MCENIFFLSSEIIPKEAAYPVYCSKRTGLNSIYTLLTPGGGGYFGVKKIRMTVGNPRKLP